MRRSRIVAFLRSYAGTGSQQGFHSSGLHVPNCLEPCAHPSKLCRPCNSAFAGAQAPTGAALTTATGPLLFAASRAARRGDRRRKTNRPSVTGNLLHPGAPEKAASTAPFSAAPPGLRRPVRGDPALRRLDAAKFRDPRLTARGERRGVVALSALRTLWFNTGTLCSIACQGCYIESSPKDDALVYLLAAEVAACLGEAAAAGMPLEEVGFTCGEPFFNRALPAMLRDVLARGLRALVLTDAMRPMRRHARELLALREEFGERLMLRVRLDHHGPVLPTWSVAPAASSPRRWRGWSGWRGKGPRPSVAAGGTPRPGRRACHRRVRRGCG